MPWKECSVMDERVRFVARLLDGEKMAALSGVRYLSQDRLQDFRSLQRIRSGSSDRPFAQTLALRPPTAAAGGGRHPLPQTGEALLGSTQNPRTFATSLFL